MKAHPALLLALLPLALAGCTGGSDDASAPVPTAAAPSCSAAPDATDIPASCVDGPDFDAVATPTGPPPSSSASIPAVTFPKQAGDLALGGNDTDPSKTTQTFTVTVPKGSRLRTAVACEGRGNISIVTKPSSGAEQEFTCGFEGEPAELTVEDSTPAAAPTTYTVTVTSPPPSRWYVAVGATDQPAPPAPQ